MPKKLRKSKYCDNCGFNLKNANYCPNCGQLNTDKQITLKQILSDFFGDYFTFDSKFFRSFIPLIRKPGYLTNQYNTGKRAKYILPLRLYIFTTFFFFFIITVNDKINDLKMEEVETVEVAANQDSLEKFLKTYQKKLSGKEVSDIAYNLDNNFEIVYRNSKNEKSVLDSIKAFLNDSTNVMNDFLKERLASDIYLNFKFERKNKTTKEKHILRLKQIFDHYSVFIDSLGRERIIARIDSVYYFKTAKKRVGNSQIIIFGKSGKEDSLSSGFEKFLESKIRKIANRGDEGGLFFLAEMLNQIPKVMFLLLPLFALLLKLFYIRRKILYINHLIFSLHLHTILFIFILLPILFTYWYIIFLVLFALWIYIFIAFLKVYNQSIIKTFIKMNAIMFIYTFVLFASIIILVFLAIFSI